MMKAVPEAIARLANATMDAINRKKKRDAANHAADTIANGKRVRHSEQAYSDMADESGRDKPE